MGDPLNVRLTGIVINQHDLPWWAVGMLNWLGMVSAMQQASGEIGGTYRALVKQALETATPTDYVNEQTGKRTWLVGPAAIYGLYQMFCARIEAESNKG